MIVSFCSGQYGLTVIMQFCSLYLPRKALGWSAKFYLAFPGLTHLPYV